MKNALFGLFLLLLLSCNEEKLASVENTNELLKALVVDETLAYMEKDYEKWASFWDHGERVLRLDVTPEGFSQTRGWAKNGGHLKGFFNEHPEPITSTFVNSNYDIYYDENLAWVAFDQKWTTIAGEESTAKATITLVKKQSDWKIISYTAIQYDSKEDTVDTLGRE